MRIRRPLRRAVLTPLTLLTFLTSLTTLGGAAAGCAGSGVANEGGGARTTSGDERAAVAPSSMVDARIPNDCDAGTVQLHAGVGEYPSAIGQDEPGAIEVHDVGVVDLDHDGEAEHLAYVRCMPGGSGTFDSVRAFHFREGGFVEVAAIEGGDRADGGLDAARIEHDAIVVGRLGGDEGGVCCPTQVIDETWQLEGGRFVRTAQGEPRAYSAE